MSYSIAILIGIYLLIFHPFERFLIFESLWFMGNITLDILRGYKRVEPAYKLFFKRAMRKHFLLCSIIGAIPLIFIMAYLVSFILQQDPHHPLIGYMGTTVAIIFFFSYEHFIAPRIPPKAITATPEVLEILRKLPDKDQIQIEKTPDGRYLRKVKPKELLPLSQRALLIYVLILVTLNVLLCFFPKQAGLLILLNFFIAGYIMEKILAPYKKDKKGIPIMPLIAKAFLVTLPFPVGLGIETFRQGLSLLASSLIALCAQLLTIAITYFVEPYQKTTLQSRQSLDQDSP